MITIDGMTAAIIEIIAGVNTTITTILTYMIMIITQVGDGEANGDIATGGLEDHSGKANIPIDLVGGTHTVIMII